MLLGATTVYIVLGLGAGLFYREFTKANGFPDGLSGQLAVAHTHILTLGALVRIARNEDHADLEALLEHAETDEVDLTAFIDQFSDEDVETLRELIGVVIREPSCSELYQLWEESGELEQWLEYSRECLP